ncbi:glycosyltransferase family 2 protein [Sulfurovum sp.]|uniref:glycosyltransferase family 2 protein n=1 Tax=Sulfurovum sp. TaxID=1969726 RepID=UPI00356551A5
MSVMFSLIVATINRYKELETLLKSLKDQTLSPDEFEVIVVDQNRQDFLKPLIDEYSLYLNINYIHSDKQGSSLHRNIGLDNAKGSIVCFPDDDCTYYPDTLVNVMNYFKTNESVDCLLGQIVDADNKKIIRDWPEKEIRVGEHNFFMLYSQITVFTKCMDVRFDENFGVGVKYGAYEDADYVFNLLKSSKLFMYTPTIKVWHPELNVKVMNLQKIKNYSMGFGAFCKKHLSWKIGFLFFQAIGFHMFKLSLGLVRLNTDDIKKSYSSILYRLKGFYEYQ